MINSPLNQARELLKENELKFQNIIAEDKDVEMKNFEVPVCENLEIIED